MPRTRRAGRKGGAGMLSNLMGKTQKTKDKEQRINQAWEQSSKDQKVWEERRVVIEKAAAEAKAKAESDAKAKAVLEAKAKAAAEAREKGLLNHIENKVNKAMNEMREDIKKLENKMKKMNENSDMEQDEYGVDRINDKIDTLSYVESLWQFINHMYVGGPAPVPSAEKKLADIQAKKAALIEDGEFPEHEDLQYAKKFYTKYNDNTTTNTRGGRTKKRRFRHPKKGGKSRTRKRRKSRTHKRR
jgi:hypothetical protein